jgi:hypothetical protein
MRISELRCSVPIATASAATIVIVAIAIFFISTARAQSKKFDPFVERLVKVTSDYLKSADAFRVKAEVTYEDVLNSGKKLQLSRLAEVMVRRPNRVRAEVLDDRGNRRVYYDGKSLSMHHLDQNVYATVDAPETIDEMIDSLRAKYGIAMPLADLLVSDIDKNFRENAQKGIYVGLHYHQGVKHHHLLLSNQNVDFQVWIEDSARPVPKKIVITYVKEPGQPQFTAILTDWDFAPRLPDLVFDFAPPVDADEVDVLPLANAGR